MRVWQAIVAFFAMALLTLPASAAHLLAEPAAGHAGLVFIDNRVALIELSGGRQWMSSLTKHEYRT